MEIYKKVNICPKNEINGLVKILETSTKALQTFCGLIDNRTYITITNRTSILIDLLIWCLNRPTKFIYSLNFVPTLFHILIMLIKHRLPSEYSNFKEDLVEFLFCSFFFFKNK